MSVVAFLQSLLDAGLTLEDAMKAASLHEAAVHPVKERSTSAQRMARKRARDAVTSDACDVTPVTTVTSDASPLPLPPSPQTPQPPTPTPGEGSIARKGRSKPTGNLDFDAFWAAYPLKVAKDAAEPAFAKALRRIPDPDPLAVILAGIERAMPGFNARPEYIPHPATWLNRGQWNDQAPPARVETRNARPHPTNTRAEARSVWSDIAADEDAARSGGDGPFLRLAG